MCLICFNNKELIGEFELGNTYKIQAIDEIFNFSPINIQKSFVPCWGSINAIIGYTDMKQSYINAISNKISKYGKVAGKESFPNIIGNSKMVIVEKYYKQFNIEEGINTAMDKAIKMRKNK